jgi:hypothetical protein
MKTSKLLQFWKILALSLGIIVSVYGCSSDKQGQEDGQGELDQNGDENAANANGEGGNDAEETEENPNAENVTTENEVNNTGMEETGANPNANANAEPNQTLGEQVPTNQAVEATAAPVNAVPAAAPAAAPAGDGSRVVRFITSNGTAVHGQADAASSQVASLNQGDAVVVAIMGGWGMIADGRYVQIDKLSEKAVPRAKTSNSWN